MAEYRRDLEAASMNTDIERRRRNQQAAQQALAAEGIDGKVTHVSLNKFSAALAPAPSKLAGRALEKKLQSVLDNAGFWTTVVVHAGTVRFYFFDEAERSYSTA